MWSSSFHWLHNRLYVKALALNNALLLVLLTYATLLQSRELVNWLQQTFPCSHAWISITCAIRNVLIWKGLFGIY